MKSALKQVETTLAALTEDEVIALRIAIQFLPISAPNLEGWLIHALTRECHERLGEASYPLANPPPPVASDEMFHTTAAACALKGLVLQTIGLPVRRDA